MNGIGLAVWISLSALSPIQRGDLIQVGLHPARVILGAVDAIDERKVIADDPTILTDGVWILRPTRVDDAAFDYLEMVLRAEGLYLIENLHHGEGPYLSVSRTAAVKPPAGPLPYRVRVVDVHHRGLPEIVKELERARLKLEGKNGRSRFIPFNSTNRLILRCPSDALLDHYEEFIATVDLPPTPGPSLRIWECRSRWGDELLRDFEAVWNDQGRTDANGVNFVQTNSLMFQLSDETWAEVKTVLGKLDPKPTDN